MKDVAAIVLAGGEGTRLNKGKPSPKPKVLYEVEGKPLISYSLEVLKKIGISKVIVIVGHKEDEVRKAIGGQYKYALQEKPLGTGDATLAGIDKLPQEIDSVVVLYGADIYLEKTLQNTLTAHKSSNATVTFATMVLDNPTGGRIIRDYEGKILAIVEEKVATDNQKKIKEVNDGCYIFKKNWLSKNIRTLPLSKAEEYFLTDLVEIAIKDGSKVATYTISDPLGWVGVDSPEDLDKANKLLKKQGK